jgi:hypothetical protein
VFYYASDPSQPLPNLGLADYWTPVFDDPRQSHCGPVSNDVGNCPADLILQQGSFYRLDLEVVGPDNWLMQWHANGLQQPFLTTDGLFFVYGNNDPAIGPNPFFNNSWTLQTEAVATPEPSTVALFGSGLLFLFGFGLVQRSPVQFIESNCVAHSVDCGESLRA